MASVLNEPYFHDEQAAFDRLEAIVWPNGPVCPKCGCSGRIGSLEGVKDKKGNARLGLKKCYDCRSQITVRMKTVFERSHVPLHIWFQAAYFLCSSKKGISANQLSRTLGVSLQTAWFMGHRLREAMRPDGSLDVMGGPGQVIEADETFVGGKAKNRAHREPAKKKAVLTLIERDGRARSFHVANVTAETVKPIIAKNADKASMLMTDESVVYTKIGSEFAAHGTVNHSANEYARLGGFVGINASENFFSIVKRGITGVYHSVSEAHLHRYMAEFDFRYNNRVKLGVGDVERTTIALRGIVGRRLTYRDSSAARA